jgi:hypothetical protein
MDSTADKSKNNIAPSHVILTIWWGIQKAVGWLAGLFTLTEEERIMAGIYTGHAGQDE